VCGVGLSRRRKGHMSMARYTLLLLKQKVATTRSTTSSVKTRAAKSKPDLNAVVSPNRLKTVGNPTHYRKFTV
jgi:hypothetical protein